MLITLGIALYMACISRACGGWFKLTGENYFYSLPYITIALLMPGTVGYFLLALAVTVIAGAMKGAPNREYMDLGTWTGQERKPHWFHFITSRLPLSPFRKDFAGLALTGLAVSLAPAIAVGCFNPIAGLVLAIGGLAKAPAYLIGLKIEQSGITEFFPKGFQKFTEIGEFLTGFFAGISIGLMLAFV